MFKIANIKALTDQLKCTQCSKLLSVLPVYYCSAIGNVCGRCAASVDWMISNGTLERAVAYEAVAKYILFPCCNQESGCNAKLKWDQVEDHERSCTIRDITCPFDARAGCEFDCSWKGSLGDLVSHLQSDHSFNMQHESPSFVMDVHESNVQVFPTVVAEQTFVLLTKYVKDTNKFHVVVMCTGKEPESQCYRFQLEIGRFDDYFLILRKNCTEQFMNTAEMVENYEKMITVDVASVTTMLNNPDGLIYCKVGITKKNKKEISAILEPFNNNTPQAAANDTQATKNPPPPKIAPQLPKSPPQPPKSPPQPPQNPPQSAKNPPQSAKKPSKSDKQNLGKAPKKVSAEGALSKPPAVKQLSKMDKQLLEELECPVCSNYMIPPIFICPTGHSICSECKNKVMHCPSCRVEIMSTRNYTLEKLAAKVPYPCRYANLGCSEVLNLENIHVHELNCVLASNRCPLKGLVTCNSKNDLVDVVAHIREKHNDQLVHANQQYARNIKSTITSSYYPALFDHEVFIVCCKHSATIGPIKFNVLHAGMQNGPPKYRFELEFLDQTNKGMKLIINQLCQPLPQSPSTALKNCLGIPLEMLEPFISKRAETNLYFKFFIQKV